MEQIFEYLKKTLKSLNLIEQCRAYRISVFACPPFLFVVLGIIIIIAMLVTTVLASNFSEDPAVVVVSVSILSAFLVMVGHALVISFSRLAEVSRMKSEFVSIVSHQLRSPLSAIKWQLELMLENVKNLSGAEQKTIGMLREQNERMIELVNDLLEVNRIEDGRLILRPTLVAIDTVVEGLIKSYIAVADKAGIKLSFETNDRMIWVFVDESKLRWITENLLENAIRYTLNEGEVKVRIIKDTSTVRVEVADNGVGIPLADQSNIFSKFFRAGNVLRLRTQGSGLGLYLVRSLVRAMNGKVGFASLEGKGSTFWFSFLVVRGDNQSAKI